MNIKVEQFPAPIGEKITFTDGVDRYITGDKNRAVEVFSNWLLKNERLPKPKLAPILKYFNLEDSETPGIVQVEVIDIKKGMPVSVVQVVKIIRPSTFRRTSIGHKYTVANQLLRDFI